MLKQDFYFLVTCVALTTSIRVDFNTNKGPIVPATPRTTVPPQLPYREPAPVWEDLSNDIPNPNPYKYVPPPPSRPRPATNNYLTSDRKPPQWQKVFYSGKIISPEMIDPYFKKGGNYIVAGLSPKYYSNIGIKYSAILQEQQQAMPYKSYYMKTPSSSVYYSDKPNKLNGKYNAKTKKHKVYDKIKYVPKVYFSKELTFPIMHYELPISHHQKYQQLLQYQKLPLLKEPQPFRLINLKTVNSDKQKHREKELADMATKIAEATTKQFLNNIIENAITRSSYDKKKSTDS